MIKIKEQEEVLNTFNKNMLVSASAGSGKTFVMVQKIISLLLHNDKKIQADIDQMLILTFTNQAADEMKAKLEKEILEQSENYPELVEQLDLIKISDISTIHAFCEKMLKRYFYEANLSSDFALISEEKQKFIFNQCVTKSINEFKQNNPVEFLNLLQTFCSSRSSKELFSLINDIKDSLENVSNEENWIYRTSTFLYSKEGQVLISNYANHKICSTCDIFAKLFLQAIDNCIDQKLKTHLLFFYNIATSVDVKYDLAKNIELIKAVQQRVVYINKDKDDFINDCIILRDKFKTDLKKYIELFDVENRGDAFLESSVELINNLISIYKKSIMFYEDIKREKNVLDFSDLEKKCAKLLENNKIKKEIVSNYKYVFIDEFQDTNIVQKRILDNFSNSFLMAVGDIKQSIYGFRGSNPKIFVNLMSEYNTSKNGENKKLNSNFRSNKDVLEFANLIFSKIMTLNNSGIDYEKTSQFESRADYIRDINSPSVDICIIDKKKEETSTDEVKLYDLTKDKSVNNKLDYSRAEARVVANKILQTVGSKIYDCATKTYKTVKFSDITILVRTTSKLDILTEELLSCGVPVIAPNKMMLSSFPEISTILCLLKLTLNFYDDVSLACGLTSYFCNLSLDDLANIRIKYPECENFYQCVENYKNNESDFISNKINQFYQFIKNLKKSIEYSGIELNCVELIENSGYSLFVGKQLNGESKLSRLKHFEQLLTKFQDLTLPEIIELFEDKSDGPKAPSANVGELDCVNISTMHASKGLEYPIVILFDCGSDFTRAPITSQLLFNSEYGFAIKQIDAEENTYNESLQSVFIKDKNKYDDFAEKIRLLYVAMTRAKNKLIVTGCVNIDKLFSITSERDINQIKTFIELILNSFNNKLINKLKLGQDIRQIDDEQNFLVEIYENNDNIEKKNEQGNLIIGKPDAKIKNQIKRYLDFLYPYSNSTLLSLKTTVSKLSFEQDEYQTYNLSPKKLVLSENGDLDIDANDLGTLYHKVFENINFNDINSLKDCEDKIKDIINAKEIKYIDSRLIFNAIQKIKPYITNNIYKEKEFIMKIKNNEIVENGLDDEQIVQGKIDLLILGDKNYIFDYKLSRINDENYLINKYKKQLKLYQLAIEKALNIRVCECFIVDLLHDRLIKM